MNKIAKPILYGSLAGSAFFLISGLITTLLPNTIFQRMTPVTALDYIFLISTSTLLGAFVSLHYYIKNTNRACYASTAGGSVGGFLGFGCAICNKLLVIVFGATGVMTYVEPLRPVIGSIGVTFLIVAVFSELKYLPHK